MEKIVIVDKEGVIRKFVDKDKLESSAVFAVELTLIYLPKEKKVVLLNRGSGAYDMHSRWALHSGRVIVNDLENGDGIKKKMSLETYKNAAVREFKEELHFDISPGRLKIIEQFYMEENGKRLFFCLFSLALNPDELKHLYPDFSEVENIKLFTLEEFRDNKQLGDAIMYKKEKIVSFLKERFNPTEN